MRTSPIAFQQQFLAGALPDEAMPPAAELISSHIIEFCLESAPSSDVALCWAAASVSQSRWLLPNDYAPVLSVELFRPCSPSCNGGDRLPSHFTFLPPMC